MIALEQTAEGVVIPVRVRAGARRTGVAGEHDGALRIDVTAAPERGKANRAVVEVLSELLRAAKRSIKLVSGETSNQKRFLVEGVDLAAAQAKISAALQGA